MKRQGQDAWVGVGRRNLILASAAALAVSAVPAQARTPGCGDIPEASVPFDDGLALPSAKPSLGQGKDRALVLGGGGE
ncbi:MAG: hypothetical protein WBF11_05860, partial [Methyloceanibacter sp.]